MTPAGERVDPDVYCKYAVSARLSIPALDPLRASRSNRSTSTTAGAGPSGCDLTYSATLPATADVVRITEGDASRSTELTRSSLAPPNGTETGTAVSPARNAPKKASM